MDDEKKELETAPSEEETEKDPEMVEDEANETVEDDLSDTDTIEEEVEANNDVVDGMTEIEPDATPENADIPTTILLDTSFGSEGGSGDAVEVEEDLNDTTVEEDGEQMIAEGEAFLRLAEDAEVEEYVADNNVSHSQAREELGIPDTEVEDETPVVDALVNEEFISAPDPDSGNDGDIVVEKFEDEKGHDGYEVASQEPFEVDENGELAVSESFFRG